MHRTLPAMTLGEYIAAKGTAAKKEIAEKTGLRWATIHDIAEGRSVPKLATAKKIAAATDNEVSVATLLGLGPSEAA